MTTTDSQQRRSRFRQAVMDAATLLTMVTTITAAGLVIYRQLSAEPRALGGQRPEDPTAVADWAALTAVGHRVGPDNADLTLVVFGDFECPGCATFATTTYPSFEALYPGRVAMIYRHWPLKKHRFAYQAARATECASAQGRFRPLHDALYRQQSEIGLKAFREFASETGVPSLGLFDKCLADTLPSAAIDRDIREIVSRGGTGTPTVFLNGWMFKNGVNTQRLDSLARAILAGQ